MSITLWIKKNLDKSKGKQISEVRLLSNSFDDKGKQEPTQWEVLDLYENFLFCFLYTATNTQDSRVNKYEAERIIQPPITNRLKFQKTGYNTYFSTTN